MSKRVIAVVQALAPALETCVLAYKIAVPGFFRSSFEKMRVSSRRESAVCQVPIRRSGASLSLSVSSLKPRVETNRLHWLLWVMFQGHRSKDVRLEQLPWTTWKGPVGCAVQTDHQNKANDHGES